MDSSIARVGSEALTELKIDLTNLSKALHEIYELMHADMRQVNSAWQDSKYQEFVDNYQPQIRKCDEIANRYTEWCTKVLDPTIENVIAVETADVSVGGGSVGGGIADGASVGSSAVAGAAAVGVAAGASMTGNGYARRITGSSKDANSNSNSEESDREKRFLELYPDASPEFAKSYFELSPEQRMEYSKEYMKLKKQHDDDMFHVESLRKDAQLRGGDSDLGAAGGKLGFLAYAEKEENAAEKQFKEGMHKLEESTVGLSGMNELSPTTKAVPISNGCGSEEDPKSFAAAAVGRAVDTKLGTVAHPLRNEFTEWKAQGESCDIHDKCYYNGEGKEKCDLEFQRRSPVMGTVVIMAKETSAKSYEQAQKDRLLSEQLRATWEKEHGQSLDAENFRVVPND